MSFTHRAAAAMALTLGTLALATQSQAAPVDPARGKELASKLCVSCHIVGEEAATATVKADVPSFKAVADKPGQTAETVAGRIVIPHPVMPQIDLTRSEIADLAAYIMSLKGK